MLVWPQADVTIFIFEKNYSVNQENWVLACDPMDYSIPGFPVHHQLLEEAHVHLIGDAIQPSHPLLSPSPPAFNLSQHEGLSSE